MNGNTRFLRFDSFSIHHSPVRHLKHHGNAKEENTVKAGVQNHELPPHRCPAVVEGIRALTLPHDQKEPHLKDRKDHELCK